MSQYNAFYPCGCKASGPEPLPENCPEHPAMPEIPCCPPHEKMYRAGTTKPLDNCFICIRNQRDELLTEHDSFFGTIRAIAVDGLGLTDPFANDAPNEMPHDWAKHATMSAAVASLRAENDRLRAALLKAGQDESERVKQVEAAFVMSGQQINSLRAELASGREENEKSGKDTAEWLTASKE